MDWPVYTGFTSHCNEIWISFGRPTSKDAGGHPIGWTPVTAPTTLTALTTPTTPRKFRVGDYSDDPRFLAAVNLRHRIIVRTGNVPDIRNGSLDRVLLELVQLALQQNLV